MTRVACLLVPDLPLQAEQRAHPECVDTALVVASGADPRADVIAVSPLARAAGVPRACTVAQARAVLPDLCVRVASPALERVARDALLDIALSLSPRAALAPRGHGLFAGEASVFLDAQGVTPLFQSERHFASVLAERARRQGLPGIVALASSRTTSLLLARRISGEPGALAVLPDGEEDHFLGPLPLDLLDPDDRLAQALTRFGVRTVRELLALPRRNLAQRLGPEVLELIARARGEAVEAPLPEPRSTRVEEAVDLDAALDRLEPLGFVLRGLISRLCERLELRALACGTLDLELGLEGGGRDARRVRLAGPSLDVRVLLRLVNLALAEHPPAAPVESVCVATEGIPRRRDQLDLFRPKGPDPTALDATLTELESLCGEGRVGSPEVRDSHHPTAFGIRPFSLPRTSDRTHTPNRAHTPDRKNEGISPSDNQPAAWGAASVHERAGPDAYGAQSTGPAPPAIRALRPPVRAEVRVDGGMPTFVRSAVAQGHVTRAAGPWRTTGHWWAEEERFALDHYDVLMSDGSVVRLCFDWLNRVWQIDGIYD